MKNFLLILILILAGFATAGAQNCEPDKTLPDSVIVFPLPYQDSVAGTGIMDTACVNTDFQTVIQFKIPESFNFNGTAIPLNSVDLAAEGAVLGVPAGFDYVCNPPNCVFKKDSVGCIVLFGNAQPGSEAVYDLKVSVTIRSLIDVPYVLPDGQVVTGNYYLHVKPEGSANCSVVGTTDLLQDYINLSNVPNPFADYTEIRVASQLSGDFSFEVYNLLGQQVQRRVVRLYEGPNYIPFDGSNLSAGMYQYVLRNRQGMVSGKMMINRAGR